MSSCQLKKIKSRHDPRWLGVVFWGHFIFKIFYFISKNEIGILRCHFISQIKFEILSGMIFLSCVSRDDTRQSNACVDISIAYLTIKRRWYACAHVTLKKIWNKLEIGWGLFYLCDVILAIFQGELAQNVQIKMKKN